MHYSIKNWFSRRQQTTTLTYYCHRVDAGALLVVSLCVVPNEIHVLLEIEGISVVAVYETLLQNEHIFF